MNWYTRWRLRRKWNKVGASNGCSIIRMDHDPCILVKPSLPVRPRDLDRLVRLARDLHTEFPLVNVEIDCTVLVLAEDS